MQSPGAGVVDVQVQPIVEHVAVALPGADDEPAALEALAARLNDLSAQGYGLAFVVQDRGYLVMARTVGLQRLQIDTNAMILPMRAPIGR